MRRRFLFAAIAFVAFLPAAVWAATTVAVGNAPMQIAVNPVTNLVYVANLNDNTVSVIDGTSNTVVATISVGVVPEVVAVNTATNRIYVANSNSNNISVIDGSTNIVIDTIASAATVFLAVNPGTDMIYADNQLASTVSVFDGSTDSLVATIPIAGTGIIPEALVVNPATNLVYLAVDSDMGNTKSFQVINGATNSVIDTIPLPDGASISWLTADLQLGRVYIVDSSLKAVYVFSVTTNSIIATVNLSSFHTPFEAAVALNHELIVSDYTGGKLIRVNPWNYGVDGSTGNGKGPSGVAVNPKTNTLYVVDTFSNMVTVIKL